MAIMIENGDWIDQYVIDTPQSDAEHWDAEIENDPNPPIFLQEVKFDWKDGMLQPVQEGQ